jgi:hypothetical protein
MKEKEKARVCRHEKSKPSGLMPRPIRLMAISHNTIETTKETYPERAVPAASAKRHSVCAYSQATDPVLVASKYTNSLTLQRIPNITSPVIITTKEYTARNREGYRCDSAQNVVMSEGVKLAVSTDIEKPARGVVGASGEGIAVGEEAEKG